MFQSQWILMFMDMYLVTIVICSHRRHFNPSRCLSVTGDLLQSVSVSKRVFSEVRVKGQEVISFNQCQI